MNWYLAKIVFRIISGEESSSQFDEQLRLIEAAGQQEAFAKAALLGQGEEVIFLNEKHKRVEWRFVNVSELRQLDGLADGAELYSRIEEQDNGDQYELIVQQKAKDILLSTLPVSQSA